MAVGGIDPHRFDLSSVIILKYNHIWSAAAIARAREVGSFSHLLDAEVRDEEEADESIAAGVNVIMLDNIEGNELVSAAQRLCERQDERWKGEESRKKILLDTSGDKTEANLCERAIAKIDILGTSAVHLSVPHINFSLKI